MRIIECGYCGYRDFEDAFEYGRGREYGEHPEHRYCPRCFNSIDWHGFGVVKVVSDTWEEFLIKARRVVNG